jgi:hypothetical protein
LISGKFLRSQALPEKIRIKGLASNSSTRTVAVGVCDSAIVRGQGSPNSRSVVRRARALTLMRIQSAFEQAGIVFLDSDGSGEIGVRLKK